MALPFDHVDLAADELGLINQRLERLLPLLMPEVPSLLVDSLDGADEVEEALVVVI